MQPSTVAKRAGLLLFAAVAAFYLYGLNHLPLVGPDEPRYAQVAREMFLRGDWITPMLGAHTWFEKPVLLYWGMIASYKLFGVSEQAARFGPALAGILTVFSVWWIARRIERASGLRGLAFIATIVIATSGGLIVFSRGASFDILITMTISWALCFFLAYETDERHRNIFLIGFYCFVGLSLLAKGLIGLILPFGIIAAFYALRWRWCRRELWVSILWGGPLTVLVAATWYAPVIARHGWPFINEFFVQHHFARYFSNKYQHPQPIYFYLPVMLMLALPWTVFLIDSLVRIKRWERRSDDSLNIARVFALAWFVVPILFFSFSGSKLPAYVLPALPAAALLIGERVTAFVRGNSTATTMRITAVTCLVLAAGGAVFARSSGNVPLACVVLLAAIAAACALISFFLASKPTVALASIAAVPVVVTLIALNCGAGEIGARNSVRDLIRRADAEGYNGSRLLMFNRIERTSEFYASGRVVYGSDGDPVKVENPDEVMAELRKNNATLLMIVPLGSLTRLQNMQAIEVKVIGDNGRNAIVAVDMKR